MLMQIVKKTLFADDGRV